MNPDKIVADPPRCRVLHPSALLIGKHGRMVYECLADAIFQGVCLGEAEPLSPDCAPVSGGHTILLSPRGGPLVLAIALPGLPLPIGRRNDTEFVAIGVGHDEVSGIGRKLPRQAGGPEGLQPCHFRQLILGIETEM
jgi:hypothetical protein